MAQQKYYYKVFLMKCQFVTSCILPELACWQNRILCKIKLMPDDIKHDANGESVEYWAAVLQQYPVSQEYLNAIKFKHTGDSEPISQVTPELLVQLEKEIDSYIDQAREQLNQSKRFDEPDSRHLKDVVDALVERHEFYKQNDLTRGLSQEIEALLR